jgi:hydrogenase small subunit
MTTKETSVSTFDTMLARRGVTRRRFLEFCGAVAVSLGLAEAAIPAIAATLEESCSGIGKGEGKLKPVIWLELASCTGCTESFAQVDTPDVASVVLELIALNYAETLSAGAGYTLEEAKKQTIEECKGNYIVIIEGALMEGWDGNALRIANEKGIDIVWEACSNAGAVVCAGSCAVDGGWQAADPNPGGAIGIQAYLEKRAAAEGFTGQLPPLINVPSCPANPEHLVAVLVDVLLVGAVPALNEYGMPQLMFGEYIHDNCPRRGHFENGEFVYQFGSEEEAKGYCLYPVGCKGPQTKNNCPIVRWNRRVSWCVEAGAPCIGCAQANPDKAGFNWVDVNAPFFKRLRNLKIGDLVFQPATAAALVGGVVLVALVAHGFGMKAAGRTKGGAPFEPIRAWDKAHPDQAIGKTLSEAIALEKEKAAAEAAEAAEAAAVTEAAEAEEAAKAIAKEVPEDENQEGGDQ